MSRLRAGPRASSTGAEEWGGRRLLAVGVAVLVTATALLGGLGYALYLILAPPPEQAAAAAPVAGLAVGSSEEQVQQRRDAIAAEPMLSVSSQAALPSPPSTQTAPGITIPPASRNGPGGVPTGFPRTPEGAVAQLAAIETTVFQAMSMPLTAAVHQHWTLPDQPGPVPEDGVSDGAAGEAGVIELDLDHSTGPGSAEDDAQATDGVAGWEIARHVQSFLGTAQMGPEKDVTTTVTTTPAAGLIKGSDGPDWVLACVLLQVRAVITTEARIGFGHCERMQWHDGRWHIAPGTPPVRAPSTWPGTQQSIDAGWRTWVDSENTLDDIARDDTAGDDTAVDDTSLDDPLLDAGETGEG